MDKESQTFEVYYDEEGDFLEISFGEPALEGTTEESEPGVFITRDVESNEITDVGILDFRRRVEMLEKVLNRYGLRVPLKISI